MSFPKKKKKTGMTGDQNINKNGNTLQFEEILIRDHGQEYVDELKRRNRETKGVQYGKDWY